MSRFGFCSGTYVGASPNADNERCINLFPETNESPNAKSEKILLSSPGLLRFSSLPNMTEIRTGVYFNGRLHVVAENQAGQWLFEVFADGSSIQRGMLGAGENTPSMAVNNASQLMIASAGRLFLFNLTTNLLSEIDTTTGNTVVGPVAYVRFITGYFAVQIKNSPKFQLSSLEDGTLWDPADVAQVQNYPDNIIGTFVDHNEGWVFGPKKTAVYYNSGNPLFPFDTIPGAFLEAGLEAPDSLIQADNSFFWLGADERGAGMAFRANGYQPQRVSNHGVEYAWNKYPTRADCVTYSFQENGHTFIHWYFPTANKSWRYDIAESQWHEVEQVDGSAHPSQCHFLAFGKHLVGDPNSGKIYEQSTKYNNYDGKPLRRRRRAPHISTELEYEPHTRFVLDIETGLGPTPPLPDGGNYPREPQAILRWSNDSGHTWSNDYPNGLGFAGEFSKRVIWRRLGIARSRTYEVEISDDIPVRIVDAYVNEPTARLAEQIRKQA